MPIAPEILLAKVAQTVYHRGAASYCYERRDTYLCTSQIAPESDRTYQHASTVLVRDPSP